MRLQSNLFCSLTSSLRSGRRGYSIIAALLSGLPLSSQASPDDPSEAASLASSTVETAIAAHEWLVYVALGLGVLNLLLFYLLYRSPRDQAGSAASVGEMIGSSSRTDKRMDKRKREIDELRQQVDELRERLENESIKRLTTAQTQELVRVLIHDELTRSAVSSGDSTGRPGLPPTRG